MRLRGRTALCFPFCPTEATVGRERKVSRKLSLKKAAKALRHHQTRQASSARSCPFTQGQWVSLHILIQPVSLATHYHIIPGWLQLGEEEDLFWAI